MKRYADCIMENSECRKCSLSSYELDCRNNPCNPLTYHRKKTGMTQVDLANASGIRQPHITRFETGERDLKKATASTVLALALALDISVEQLLQY